VTTGSLLMHYQQPDHTFTHPGAFEPLRDVNWISFGALLTVTVAGIVDAFVVGAKRSERDRQADARLGY
jgi:hypothetical protein